MNPAPCAHCGATVLTYRQFAVHIRPTTDCPSCGKRVRMRGYFWNLFGAIAALAVTIAAASVLDSLLPFVALTLAAVIMEIWTWRALPWEPTNKEPTEAAVASDESAPAAAPPAPLPPAVP